MQLFSGILYNLRGLKLGLTTPKLLVLGIVRFVAVVLITIVTAGVILLYHQEILHMIWNRPESRWVLWLWHLLSWLLSLFLVGVSTLLAYLVTQIVFAVIIMDRMSRITERMLVKEAVIPDDAPVWAQFIFLIKQEIPRAVLPVLLMMFLLVVGWLTPAGPVIAVVSSAVTVIFLAWDNTDLLPARNLRPFSERFSFLMKTLPFHLGFGLLFLIPLLNLLFLSFAPVGATLYIVETQKGPGT